MRRPIFFLAMATLLLLPSACGFVSGSDKVGTQIGKIVNGVPANETELSKYCTAYSPDPELHRYTIAELVDAGKPFVVVFGTPSHCTQCQNQLDTVRHYRDKYDQAFEVIHIDQYKNEQVYTALMVKGDPWTFLVNASGTITAVYPGVTTWDDLDGAILNMIGKGKGKGKAAVA